jgi:hypothetical protein
MFSRITYVKDFEIFSKFHKIVMVDQNSVKVLVELLDLLEDDYIPHMKPLNQSAMVMVTPTFYLSPKLG